MTAKVPKQTREDILKVAVEQFARSGYAGTSVQNIVSAAKITKPTLYYHFGSKQGLYREVVHMANDECYRLMRDAAERSDDVPTQLVDILAALFAFTIDNRERTRIVFSAAFVPLAEAEPDPESDEQGWRNFMLVYDIIQNGIEQGVLDATYTAMDLTRRVYGVLTFEIMVATLQKAENPSREDAENIIAVFMHGAANRNVCRPIGKHS